MKKIYAFYSLLVIAGLLFSACKSTKEVSSDPKAATDAPIDETELAVEIPADSVVSDSAARTFFASLERTPCFGRCPTYKMIIYSDGFVEFDGIRDVPMIGKYTTKISEKQLQEFVHSGRAIGFLEMEDRYDGMVSDLPSATTTMVLDGQRKSVYRRYDYPQRLATLEKLFDNLIESAQWKDENGQAYPPDH